MSKRDQILETAVALFVEQGVESTPTSQISKEAGVATGTLFHHFPNKDELVKALVMDVKQSILEAIEERLDTNQELKEQFRAIWLGMLEWAVKNPVQYKFKSQLDNLVQLDEETIQQMETMFAGVYKVMGNGLASGAFKEMNPEYVGQTIQAQMKAAAEFSIENPTQFAKPSHRDLMFESMWDSIKK